MSKYLNILLICLLVGCNSPEGSANSEFDSLKNEAQQGDIRAQSKMGDVYLFGEYDLKVDYKKAFYWYSKASGQGDAKSQYNLAIMYLNGYGIEKNSTKAVEFYQKAALQGDADSQLQLGIRYLNGEGVNKNVKTAKYWFDKAKASGNNEAEMYLKELKEK